MIRAALWAFLGLGALGLTGSAAGAEEPPFPADVLEGDFEIEVPAAHEGETPILTLRGHIRITPDRPWRTELPKAAILHLIVVPWANVTVGENNLGRVFSTQAYVVPGTQAIRIEHPDYKPLRRRLRFLPGQTQRLVVDLAEEAIVKAK